jgi:glycosyltransferase involved in cell wall biosynthesis
VPSQVAGLREELSDLRGASAQQHADLAARIEKVAIVATEHPDIASATAAPIAFPSPAVSVIMPTWNRGNDVGAAIRSVQAQRFADWELIVVDDGGSDDTASVMAAFAADRRIRYVREQHAGQCAARNAGLRLAKGALIAYLDSDNLWFPGYLAGAVAMFATHPEVDCAYGAMVTQAHGDQRILFESFDRQRLLRANYIGMSTFIHRRSLLERYGGFDEGLVSLEDWDLILRYTSHAPAYRLPFLAVRYRVVDDKRVSALRAGDPMAKDFARVRSKWAS